MCQHVKDMVQRVSWFKPIDYEILLFFDAHDIEASSQVVAANIDYSRRYVNRRLVTLTGRGLFENRGKGLYELSERGRAFLAGEVDARELEDHED